MKTAPVENPRQLTPAFAYAINFLGYDWYNSLDESGAQSKSLGPVNSLTMRLDSVPSQAPLYQVHELPVLDQLQS